MVEKLPLSYCETWPLWCASPADGGAVSLRLVNALALADNAPGLVDEWVNPLTFEELWLPEDLPLPTFHLALTFVLKNGTPRYICPGIDATIVAGGREWRNRGLCSVPMAKTWLPWQHIPVEQMRISAYVHPPAPEGEGGGSPCEPLAVMLPVARAVSMAAEVLAEAPSELATSGFAYLTVRLPLDDRSRLESTRLAPGSRLRVFLSDEDSFPTSIDSEDESWAWERGECDVRLRQISAGGTSAYLPDCYKPLYGLGD